MEWLTYNHFKDFQTALVGIIGFAGVIITLRSNAKLAERQHLRELASRAHALRGSILCELSYGLNELRQTLSSYERLVFTVDGSPDFSEARQHAEISDSYVLPEIDLTLTNKLVLDIGILDDLEINSVFNAWSTVSRYNSFINHHSWHKKNNLLILKKSEKNIVTLLSRALLNH